MNRKQKLIIAYLGNGKSTNRYHLPYALLRNDKIRVKYIWKHSEKASWKEMDGIQYTTDIDTVLNDPDVQVVVVTAATIAHTELTKKALLAGKHVVCEKPMALSYKEAEECFQIAQERNLVLQAYQNRRFDSDFLTVKSVLESGRLGDLFEMEMHFDYYRPEVPQRAKKMSREDSFLYCHACHTLDQVISLFGKPDSVVYDVRTILHDGRMNDYFDLDLFYGKRKISIKSSYFRVKPRPSFVAYGTKGMFEKKDTDRQEFDLKKYYMPTNADFGLDTPEFYGTLTYMDEKGQYHEEKVPTIPGSYAFFYDALYDTIVNGEPPLVTKEQTLLQMYILEQGIQIMENKNNPLMC